MITREEYNKAVKKYFNFLVENHNFTELNERSQNSMLYDVEYSDKDRVISISYEIMGEGVNVVIFKIIDGIKSGYDDYENTIHLNQIIKGTKKEETLNHLKTGAFFFEKIGKPESEIERELFNKATLLASFMETSIWSEKSDKK